MAVKHIETEIIHKVTKGGKTGCGFNTNDHPKHWVYTSEKVTCDKDGCENKYWFL